MSHNRYHEEIYISTPIGPNATDIEARKRKSAWPDNVGYGILRIPPMIVWTIDDVRLSQTWYAYEMLDDRLPWGIRREKWLANLVEIKDNRGVIATKEAIHNEQKKVIYIIDNHHHAFYCRYKAYHDGILPRWSTLIHIDQHSDLNELSLRGTKQSIVINRNSTTKEVATYTNTILDIGSFILPALDSGIIIDQIQVRSEYSLLHFHETNSPNHQNAKILNIDLDFRAPEMSIEHYSQTIKKVRELIASPEVKCITIATSPAFIDQDRALEILRDIIG